MDRWIVLAASFSLNYLCLSMYTCFPVLLVEFSEVFDGSVAEVGLIGSIYAGIWHFTGFLMGSLTHHYGSRLVGMAFSLIGSVGFVASAFAPDLHVLYASYGLLAGAAAAGTNLAAYTELQRHFKKRSLVNGISTVGGALSTFTIPPLYRLLITWYTWRGAMLIHAGVLLHGLAFSALLIPAKRDMREVTRMEQEAELASLHPDQKDEDFLERRLRAASVRVGQPVTHHVGSGCTCTTALCDVSLVSNRNYWLFGVIGHPLLIYGSTNFYQASVARGVSKGLDKMSASLLLSVTGLFSMLGRIVFCSIGNIEKVNRKLEIASVCILGGLFSCVSCFSREFYTSIALAACYGTCFGAYTGLYPTVMVDIVGVDLISKAIGWSMTVSGISALTSLPLTGLLYDLTGNYDLGFYVTGGFQVVGGLATLLSVMLQQVKHEKLKDRHNI